jgi:CMP-N,N'-diacetyllegionaminic acid synthase
MNSSKILAIIPARSGSKGVPQKNIRLLNNKPLIQYTIECAKESNKFDRIVVSTDSSEIEDISVKLGVKVPFLRPSELATDYSPTIDSVIYTIDQLRKVNGESYEFIMLLQPTSPLRNVEDIINSVKLLKDDATSLVSVNKIDEPHPFKMKVIYNNRIFPYIHGTDSSVPRQKLQSVYALNGAIYLIKTNILIKERTLITANCIPYIMPAERSININTHEDFNYAEYLLNK